jgi:hypothetical protein
MPPSDDAIREHLIRALDWEDAHVGLDRAVEGIPPDKRGARAPGFEHSAWQLVEHIRIAQDDILDFCVNAQYVHAMKWPDDYWPEDAAIGQRTRRRRARKPGPTASPHAARRARNSSGSRAACPI